MQWLLLDLPKNSYGALGVGTLSNVLKTGKDAKDVGWATKS